MSSSECNKYKKEKIDGRNEYAFCNINKMELIQESRYFDSTPVNPKKSVRILTKILYLLNQGEKLSTQESTSIFIATTKLFQCKDLLLRRLVYLCLKELSTTAQDIIIATSSLIKDVIERKDLYRAAAIRALCKMIATTYDAVLLTFDRCMRQAIVDGNLSVRSAALVSALHLAATAPDLVRRWVNETQEVISTHDVMVTYHALAVVMEIRKKCNLSVIKLIATCSNSTFHSPFAVTLLIRHAAKLVIENASDLTEQFCLEFIRRCLRHRSDIVVYEAAFAIVCLKKNSNDIAQAMSVLELYCTSPKAIYRFVGIRALSKITTGYGVPIATLENLLSDQNKSVALIAYTTLLSMEIERLNIDKIKKIVIVRSDLFFEIPQEVKLTVLRAIREVCLQYPQKTYIAISFFGLQLKGKGGVDYKIALTDAIIALIAENHDVRDMGLVCLCEYIEDINIDGQYLQLASRIMQVLGREGPKARQPFRYVRCLYNRILLGSDCVRAAAITAIAHFGALRTEFLHSIRMILSHCQLDESDEVRDRAVFYTTLLNSEDSALIEKCMLMSQVPNIISLEKTLGDHLYLHPDIPFNIPQEDFAKENLVIAEAKKDSDYSYEQDAQQLKSIPGFENLGQVFQICDAIDLTEPDLEFRICCTKHIFAQHLVLHFECWNMVTDQVLENVHVHLQSLGDYKIAGQTQCRELTYETHRNIFCTLEFPKNPKDSLATFEVMFEFIAHDYDPRTGQSELGCGYFDMCPLSDITISCKEQFKAHRGDDNWDASWDGADSEAEVCDTSVLVQTNIMEAMVAVCEHLGLATTPGEFEKTKEIKARCLWRSGGTVLLRARFTCLEDMVTMEVVIRSSRQDIAALILSSLH